MTNPTPKLNNSQLRCRNGRYYRNGRQLSHQEARLAFACRQFEMALQLGQQILIGG
ncbi:hypothetical protein KUW19_00105 [Ferrimonas balearica]|uniref:hypothetical protein n=1 Tax=Ferrimonas balearica TaxID=44012 RepID=UPI001C962BF1|nr:hypothetical protein [Ferrimonas balearica]MBY6104883.1 hypothetical protein [Ferrimonas balearica]